MTTARALARETLTCQIIAAARARLAVDGPVALSLRAVARDVGMVSSAVYRYVPSRDALLTALIIETYNELGEAVEVTEAAVSRDDLAGRWLAAARALRAWAHANPGEFALLYGSPVPGYAAPPDTIAPASRVAVVLARIAGDAQSRATRPGKPARHAADDATSALASIVAPARAFAEAGGLIPPEVPDEAIACTLMAWSGLFGAVSFEIFGHFTGVVTDPAAWFDEVAGRLARDAGVL